MRRVLATFCSEKLIILINTVLHLRITLRLRGMNKPGLASSSLCSHCSRHWHQRRHQTRLQNSPYFCVFKYVQTVKLKRSAARAKTESETARALRAFKTLSYAKPILRKNRLFCSLLSVMNSCRFTPEDSNWAFMQVIKTYHPLENFRLRITWVNCLFFFNTALFSPTMSFYNFCRLRS